MHEVYVPQGKPSAEEQYIRVQQKDESNSNRKVINRKVSKMSVKRKIPKQFLTSADIDTAASTIECIKITNLYILIV